MPTEKIKYTDNLKQGTDKLNSAIEAANTAETLSTNADQKATQALTNSESTQDQLDTIVINGDSSVEAAQARVSVEGTTYTTLRDRLDNEYQSITADLAEKAPIELVDKTIDYASKGVRDYIYNFDVGLSKWYTALAAFRPVSSKTINVVLPGDSISSGNAAGNQDPTQYFTNGYLGQLKNKFNTNFGNAGRGFIATYEPIGAPLWSFTGFVQESGFFGPSGISRMSQVSGDTATFAFTGTGIGIVFPKRAEGGILSVSIDGGVPVLIDTYSVTQIYADKYEITGLSNGNHTVVITSQLTTGQKVWIHGAYEISSSTGIRFNMVGRSGATVGVLSTDAAMPAEIDVWSPTLTIIPLIANDYGGQTSLATYEANLQTLITRAKQYGDVLLVSVGLRVPLVSETIPQSEYVKIMKKLADLNKVAFFDVYNYWGGDGVFAKEKLGFIFDDVHPTDLGHSNLADGLYEALTYGLHQSSVLATERSVVSQGTLSSGVIGRGLQKRLSKAFGHRQETTARDFIIFNHNAPAGNSDSATILGQIKIVFAGRNTGGVRAYAAKEYDFYYDNNGNMTITERLTHTPTTSSTNVTMSVTRKGTESVMQITVNPSSNGLTGSIFVEVNYVQSFITDPIEVIFSSGLI